MDQITLDNVLQVVYVILGAGLAITAIISGIKYVSDKVSKEQFIKEIYKTFLLAEKVNLLNDEKIEWCSKIIASKMPKAVKRFIKEETIVDFLENLMLTEEL